MKNAFLKNCLNWKLFPIFILVFNFSFHMNAQLNGPACNIPNVPIIGQSGVSTNISTIGVLPSEVIIRGQLVIDVPTFYIDNTILHMDEGSQIFVLANKQLSIGANTSFLGCQKMWKGIYVDGEIIAFAFLGLINISDAERAITVSYLSNQSLIIGCNFTKNIKDICYPVGQNIGYHNILWNTCIGSSSLLPAYAGQSNYTSSSFISFEFENCNLIGISNNNISNYVIGIKSGGSNLNVYNNKIKEVTDANLSLYSSNLILDFNDLSLEKSSCGTYLNSCAYDIRNANSYHKLITSADKLQFVIHATQSLPFVDGEFSKIRNNFLSFNSNTSYKGIDLWNNSNGIIVLNNELTFSVKKSNEIISLSTNKNARVFKNILRNTGAFIGDFIKLSNSPNNAICYNTLDIDNYLTNNNINGINLENGSGTNVVNRNIITGIDLKTNINGIQNNNCINSIGCNKLDNLEIGLRVLGGCVGSIIETNRFNSGRIGLYYNSNAETGSQTLTGNIWKIGNHTLGGQHDGGSFTVAQSTYLIDKFNTLSTPPLGYTYDPVVNVANWFNNSLIAKSTLSCDEPLQLANSPLENNQENLEATVCGTILPISPTDTGIVHRLANGTLQSEQPAGSFNIIQRQVYNNWKTAGDYTSTTEASQLYNSFDNGVIGQFDHANKVVNSIIDLNQNLLENVKTTNAGIYQKMNAILAIDKLGNTINTPERTILTNELAQLSTTWRQQQLQMQQEKVSKAVNALSLVSALPVTDLWMQNEKNTYRIYIDYIISNQVPSETDRLLLRSIAAQCVAEGGIGVTVARSMYSSLFHESFTDDCNLSVSPRSNQIQNKYPLQIFPNPANDNITVTLPFFSSENDILQIIDRDGKILKTMTVDENTLNINLDISNLVSGYYYCKYNNQKESTIQKFVKIN